jgi:uncharacterized protein (DUF2235 family)
MSKRVVVCCDGTWNTPDEISRGLRAPTNVAKVALAVTRSAEQPLYYQRGVGTRPWQQVQGGGFGYGLSRNIRDCYRFVVDCYEPGDELYFIGFSRGAYTVRSTVGLIRNCGILRPQHRDRIDEAYTLYRSRAKRNGPNSIESQIFRRAFSHGEIDIHFLGVWDTVGTIGIPIGLRVPFVYKYYGFHDMKLSSHVRSAYHAIAIDERRGPFTPAVWEDEPRAPGQTVEQVWFAGVHKDVGGGYGQPALAEIPLLWMVNRARARGLQFDADHFVATPGVPDADPGRVEGRLVDPDALADAHESRTGPYRLLWPKPRVMGVRTPLSPAGQSAASTAVERLSLRPGYEPPALEAWQALGWPETPVP